MNICIIFFDDSNIFVGVLLSINEFLLFYGLLNFEYELLLDVLLSFSLMVNLNWIKFDNFCMGVLG